VPRFNLDALFVPRRNKPPPPRPTVDLPDLERLLRDRLQRDFTAEDATAAVLAFRADSPPDVVAGAAAQAEELAGLAVPDEHLDQILVLDLGSGYWPPRLGQDVRTWLLDVARLLRDG
jgi:hypothetical protein